MPDVKKRPPFLAPGATPPGWKQARLERHAAAMRARPRNRKYEDAIKGSRFEGRAEQICRVVAERYGITVPMLRIHSNVARFSHPRQIAAYLLTTRCQFSLPRAGRVLGGFNHTTILHSRDKIANLVSKDPDVAALIEDIAAEASIPRVPLPRLDTRPALLMPEPRQQMDLIHN